MGRSPTPIAPETAAGREVCTVGRRQPHGGVGALIGVAKERTREPCETGQRRTHARGVGPARMHGGEVNLGTTLRPHLVQDHLHALRGRVLTGSVIGIGSQRVGGRHRHVGERRRIHTAGRNGDHPTLTAFEERHQLGRHDERTHHLGRQRGFQTL